MTLEEVWWKVGKGIGWGYRFVWWFLDFVYQYPKNHKL